MKIAIFGDSYADYKPYCGWTDETKCWAYKLEQDHEVVNYAKGGSGLEWSYSQVHKCKEIDSFDKIIFIVSGEMRLYVNRTWHKDLKNFELHVPGAPWASKENSKFYRKNIVPAARSYYNLFDDSDILEVRQKVYLESLRNRFADKILILAAFNIYENNKEYFDNPNLSLQEIFNIESKSLFGVENGMPGPKQYQDLRACHFTEENHDLLLNNMKNWVNGRSIKLEKRYVRTSFKNPEQYKLLDK